MRCDVAVIGSGPGGFYCALGCAAAGLRTVLAERDRLGGTGFRWGCLPVKIMLDTIRQLKRGGRSTRPAQLLDSLRRRLPEVERRLARRLAAAGVEVVQGQAALAGSEGREVLVGERTLQARAVVIATGSEPADWPAVPLDGLRRLSHRDLVGLPRLPRRLLVLGGDVEGIELACLLACTGVQVTVVEKQVEALPGQDRDLAAPVVEGLRARGVRLLTGCAVAGSGAGPRGLTVELADGRRLDAPAALLTGLRRPNLPGGLEAAGVRPAPGGVGIAVDDTLQTSCPGVYAVGDINGLSGMAHAAIEQGLRLARHLGGALVPGGSRAAPAPPRAYTGLARALFTVPEIAGAGLQERELAARGTAYCCRRVELADTWRGLAQGRPDGFAKVLSAPNGTVLGVWVCGENASEMASHFGLLLERGLSADELLHGLPIHPTLGEALLEAALGMAARAAPPAGGVRPQDPA